MGKVNGKIVIPGAIVVVLVSGLIGYGELKNKVSNLKEVDVKIKTEADKLEEKHNEDVKEINTNLKTLIELVQAQAVMNGKMQTTMEYIQKDVEEIKNNK